MRRPPLALALTLALGLAPLTALPGCADEALPGASGGDLSAPYDGAADGGGVDAPAVDAVTDTAADEATDEDVATGAAPDAVADAAPDAEDDTSPSCTTWTPFYPPGPATGWKHTSTELFTVTQGSPRHRGQDVVAVEGAPQVLIGKFAYGVFDKDLKNEDVEVFLLADPPCGPWVSLGVRETSEDGEYGTQYGIEDDGGRVFFTIPPLLQRPEGVYPVRMLVHGDNSVAAFTLYVVKPGTSAVVFDIDGTLTTDDTQLGIELFKEMFSGDYIPDFYPGGPDVAHAWADRGTLVVYLTGRPDWLRRMTAQTLLDYDLPPGPLHLTDTNSQALPTSGGVATYKADFLNLLQSDAELSFEAAYGNATTDIEAYANAGFPKDHTYIIGKHAGEDGTQALDDYPSHLPTVQALPPATVPAPTTYGW